MGGLSPSGIITCWLPSLRVTMVICPSPYLNTVTVYDISRHAHYQERDEPNEYQPGTKGAGVLTNTNTSHFIICCCSRRGGITSGGRWASRRGSNGGRYASRYVYTSDRSISGKRCSLTSECGCIRDRRFGSISGRRRYGIFTIGGSTSVIKSFLD